MKCVKGEKFHREDGIIDCKRIKNVSTVYTLNFKPTPLARTRVSDRRVYDSQKNEKLIMGISLINQHENKEPFDGILHFDVTFYFGVPENKKKKDTLIAQFYHNYKPDLSNLIKMLEDICVDSKIIKDDSIISSMLARKVYITDKAERTEFTITQIK